MIYSSAFFEIKSQDLGGKTAEVIDVLNDDVECYLYYNGHTINLYGSMGGRINDDFVLCGGGWNAYPDYWGYDYSFMSQCLILGKEGPPGTNPFIPVDNLYMKEPRFTYNGGVILPNNTIFMAG